MRRLSVLVLGLVFASSCFAQSAKFNASFKDGGRAKMKALSIEDKKMGVGNAVVLFHQSEDGTFESVIEITYPYVIDGSVAGLTAILGKKLLTDSTKSVSSFTPINVMGMEGLVGSATTSISTIHIEVFAVGDVLYEMTAAIRNTGDQTEAQRFFDSFVLTQHD